MKYFGEFIKLKREELGIPQRIIATSLNIDTSTLSKIERNERKATASMIKTLSKQLNIPLKQLEFQYLKDAIISDYNTFKFLKENLIKISKEL